MIGRGATEISSPVCALWTDLHLGHGSGAHAAAGLAEIVRRPEIGAPLVLDRQLAVGGPVPIGQAEIRVAEDLLAHLLEADQVEPVPGQEDRPVMGGVADAERDGHGEHVPKDEDVVDRQLLLLAAHGERQVVGLEIGCQITRHDAGVRLVEGDHRLEERVPHLGADEDVLADAGHR